MEVRVTDSSLKQHLILGIQMCHRPRQLSLHCHYAIIFELQGIGCFLGFFSPPCMYSLIKEIANIFK